MQTHDLRSIVRAAVELTSRHDRAAVLDAMLAELERLVPAELTAVLVTDAEGLHLVAGRGFRRDVELSSLHFRHGTNRRLDRAMKARGTVRFTDPTEPDPYDGLAAGSIGRIHSCMAAPMRFDGKVLGLITADALEPDRFTEAHAELMELFAALAGVAIQNANLVASLEETTHRLEAEVARLDQALRVATTHAERIERTAHTRGGRSRPAIPPAVPVGSLRQATERFQLATIEAALRETGGNLAAAAQLLEEDRSNLHRRLTRLRAHLPTGRAKAVTTEQVARRRDRPTTSGRDR